MVNKMNNDKKSYFSSGATGIPACGGQARMPALPVKGKKGRRKITK
jgi:hypothetical protein